MSNSGDSKEYYVKNLEKYEELDMETREVLRENIAKITFGMGIILCSIPIAFVSDIDGINNISASISSIASSCMFISGFVITLKDLFDILISIVKKISCTNEINKIKTKLNILYNSNVQLEAINHESKVKQKK